MVKERIGADPLEVGWVELSEGEWVGARTRFEEGEERVRGAYGRRALHAVGGGQAQVRPDNVFRSNQNIRPGA